MGIFDNDRPEGYEEKDGKPAIHPEKLDPNEKLAMKAEDIEEFIEHYGQDDGPVGRDISA